jgi:hypothetical protein
MQRTGEQTLGGRGEGLAVGAATLVVALLGYVLVSQLDDRAFPWVIGGVAATLGVGAYLIGRTHPSFLALGRAYTWSLWVPAAAWFVASALLLRVGSVGSGMTPALVAAGVLGVLLLAQQRELQLSGGKRRGAEFLVSLATFVSAFALFSMLDQGREQALPVALLSALVAGLLAVVPLRRAVAEDGRTALYCLIVGLTIGQVAWALAYWTTPAIVGGGFLLLLFYVLVGVCEAVLDRSFSRRILLEYAAVGAGGLALIVAVGPWRA